MRKLISHKAVFFTLALGLVFCHHSAYGQKNIHDGIKIGVDANRATYYQGEPFRIYFEIENLSSSVKPYYKPLGSPNLKYELKNLQTGQIIYSRKKTIQERFYTNGINEKLYIPPKMKAYESVHIGKKFGTVLLTSKPVTGSSITKYNLVAIPVGEYQLTLSYSLQPSDKVISATHKFKVLAPPTELMDARNQYIEAIYYANETGFNGKKNYSPGNPNSYENFLKNYGSTVFADYAWIDMIITIYSHPGPSSTEMIKKWNEYINHYSSIEHEDVKLNYVQKLPIVVASLENKKAGSAKAISQKILKNDMKNSHRASELFILGNVYVQGLQNYATKQEQK